MDFFCDKSSGDFFTQKLRVGNLEIHSWEYCKNISENKKVLHIGCSDFPIFNKDGNLHIHLCKFAKEIHGCDTNGLEELRKHQEGTYFNSVDEVIKSKEKYDLILVPNIIEHLPNAGEMVEKLSKIKFKEMFILVPNYFISKEASYENDIFTERVHPDHYSWYSTYTLWNMINKYIPIANFNCEMNFFDNKNMISILIKNG